MDPFTLATAFASIVGLICNFKQERQGQGQATKEEFMSWLNDHQHHTTKEYIEENTSLCNAIETLLNQNHETVMEKLEFVDNQLSHILSRIEGFDQIVSAINPTCQLSEQAISMLRWLNDTKSDGMVKIKIREGTSLMPIPGGKCFEVGEPRFLEDDLNALVSLGLLNLSYNSQRNEKYGITRQAVALIELLNKE